VETVRLDEGLLRTTAPNGLVVLTERLPGVRSAAVGIYVRTASAHEPPAQLGISHMLEHMVFKGTERRSARELALELEVRGGGLDAFTGRDYTSYQAHILDADLPLAVEILTDLVRRPLLRQSDLESERNVVLEEINAVADTPDDLVFELHARALWPKHPYGFSILGTRETLHALSAGDLRAWHQGWFEGATREMPRGPVIPEPGVRGGLVVEERDTAQTHIVFGTDTFPLRDPRRFPLAILTNVFGGGMSSRLFQRIREELGLAYGVFAYKQFFQGSGQLGVYVGTQGSTADQAIEAIREEYGNIASDGLPLGELSNGKQQLKGQIMLSLESPAARMGRLAGFVLHDDEYRPLDAMLAEIDRVTPEEVAAVAGEFFAPDRQTIVRLGPEGQ
jgi:predicted Zn-dependent peptidase